MEGFGFQVKVKRTNRKKSASITLVGGIVKITVPKFMSDYTVRELIKKRTSWINIKLKEQSLKPPIIKKNYISGELFPYLGKNFKLKVINGERASIKLVGGYLVIKLQKNEINIKNSAKFLLQSWYKKHAEDQSIKKTNHFSKIVGVTPKSISIKNYKSRWGSCSIDGELSYNWRIILAPHHIVDYVVVHELCHLLEHNHSPRYWQHVENYFPEWKNSRNWLRQNYYIGSL